MLRLLGSSQLIILLMEKLTKVFKLLKKMLGMSEFMSFVLVNISCMSRFLIYLKAVQLDIFHAYMPLKAIKNILTKNSNHK